MTSSSLNTSVLVSVLTEMIQYSSYSNTAKKCSLYMYACTSFWKKTGNERTQTQKGMEFILSHNDTCPLVTSALQHALESAYTVMAYAPHFSAWPSRWRAAECQEQGRSLPAEPSGKCQQRTAVVATGMSKSWGSTFQGKQKKNKQVCRSARQDQYICSVYCSLKVWQCLGWHVQPR